MKNLFYTLMAAMLLVSCSTSKVENKEWHEISAEEISGNFVADINDGMLLSAGMEGDMNTMTIGWGGLGKLWRRNTFTVYVSGSRYTHEFMERNEYFTVCRFDSTYHDQVIYMGTHSGRDGDKVAASGLTLRYTDLGHPYYDEANLMIECKLLYKDVIDPAQAPADMTMYETQLPHTMYVGEIVKVLAK